MKTALLGMAETAAEWDMLDQDYGTVVRQSDTYARLLKIGVSDRLARQWITKHGGEVVDRKLGYMKVISGVRNPVKYHSAVMRTGGFPVSDQGRAQTAGFRTVWLDVCTER